MKINISAIGKISEHSPEGLSYSEYKKRLPWEIELRELQIKKNYSADNLIIEEGKLLLESIAAGSKLIVLDERGRQFSSRQFASIMQQYQQETGKVSFIIGGAYGLAEFVRQRADLLLSLSLFTLPHMLARVVLIEQIYRSFTIINNHPYHK